MSSKTFVLAAMATLAAQSVAFSVPACWQTCFDKHNVTTEDVLCENSAVNSCVGYLCHETDAAAAGGTIETSDLPARTQMLTSHV